MGFVVEQVTSGVTWRLRQQVLRPHQAVAEMALSGDDDPGGAHFAAYHLSGSGEVDEVIGVASVLAQDEPDRSLTGCAWRLRGMATAPQARRLGVGAALLERVVAHVVSCGGALLWANARVGALPFYRAHGFSVASSTFDVPHTGGHVRVHRPVS